MVRPLQINQSVSLLENVHCISGPGWLNELVGLPNNSYKLINNAALFRARSGRLQ
jgi:hypothetical protein